MIRLETLKKTSGKKYRALLMAIICLTSLAAWAAKPSNTATPAAPAELKIWHVLGTAHSADFQGLAADFHESEPAITLTIENKNTPAAQTQALQEILKARNNGQLPDIVQLDSAEVHRLRTAGLKLRTVSSLLPAATLNASPLFLRASATLNRDAKGKWLNLPMMNAVPVLFINRQAMEKAGLEANAAPTTWRALQTQLIALQASGSTCPLASSWQSWVHVTNLSATHGAPFLSGRNGFSTEQPRAAFNGTLHMRHLALMRTWVKSRLLTTLSANDAADERFVKGECAMLLSSTAALGKLRTADKAPSWRMALVPVHDAAVEHPVAPVVGGSAWWVVDTGEPFDAAKRKALEAFLSYLVSPVVAARWHQETGYLPLTEAAYRASQTAYYDTMPGEAAVLAWVNQAGKEALEIRVPDSAALNKILDEELDAIWAGDKPPQAGMTDAIKRLDALLTRSMP